MDKFDSRMEQRSAKVVGFKEDNDDSEDKPRVRTAAQMSRRNNNA
jgi:hypothetical protein